MVSKVVKVTNEQGLHMRPATVFSAACIKCGAEIEIQADGPDEEAALAKAVELVESGLGD